MRNKFFLFLLLFPHFPPYLPLPNPNWDIMIPRGNDYILGNKGVKWWNLKSNFTKSCKNTYFAYPLDCLPSILLPCPPPFPLIPCERSLIPYLPFLYHSMLCSTDFHPFQEIEIFNYLSTQLLIDLLGPDLVCRRKKQGIQIIVENKYGLFEHHMKYKSIFFYSIYT